MCSCRADRADFVQRFAGRSRELDATRTLPISALNEPILLEPAFEGLRIEYDLCMAAKPGPDESESYRLRDDIRGPTNATDRPHVSCIAKLKPCPMRDFNKLALISS